jgi:hypothetical protein
MKTKHFFTELKRHNLYKVAVTKGEQFSHLVVDPSKP